MNLDWLGSDLEKMTMAIIENLKNIVIFGVLAVIVVLVCIRLGKYLLDRVVAGSFHNIVREVKDYIMYSLLRRKRKGKSDK